MKYLKLFEKFDAPIDSELYKRIYPNDVHDGKSPSRHSPKDKFNSRDKKILLKYLGDHIKYPSAEEMADRTIKNLSDKPDDVVEGILGGKTIEQYREDRIAFYQEYINGVQWYSNGMDKKPVRRVVKLADNYYIVVLNEEQEIDYTRDYITYLCDGYDGLKELLKLLKVI